ncbi:MAG: ABC transporter ATP-binding protein [Christensenellaceae bacterium]|nr:ABC transporter ATP-binding protein [Christensenellaceae bacterium]
MSEKRQHPPMGRGRMNMPPEKAKDFKGSLKKLIKFMRPFTAAVIIALICDILGVVTRLLGPGKISEITNLIKEGLSGSLDINGIIRICIFLIVIYVSGAALNYITSLIMTHVTQKVNRTLRHDISLKINRLPVSYFYKTSTGDVLSRVTNDVDTIGQTLQQSIVTLVSAVTMFVGSVLIMFITEPILAATAILSSSVGFIFMNIIMKRSQKFFSARQKCLGAINGHVEEMYSGHNIVRLFNSEDREKQKFDGLNEQMYRTNWKSQFFSGLMHPIMNFVGNFGYVAVCIAGAALALSGRTPFGTIVAFMVYVRLFTTPLSQLAQAATQLQSTAAASERVFEFLNAKEMEPDAVPSRKPKEVRGEVVFDHVRFGYDPQKTIIKNFSEHIMPGQKIAIVGPTGSGKTTLVNLLMRFYEVDSGRILIDGIPIKDISRKDIHDMFGMVLQDTWLMNTTIRENIVYGKEGVSDSELWKVLRTVGLFHFVRTLPDKLDTVIDEKLSLSSGQKQLMTIARAMIENAPMLILDEATSSVDTRTEALLQKAMDRLTSGRTSFVIAHRLSTIKNADNILVLKDGDVIETGTHKELMDKNGFYAELYNSQFDTA